MTRSFIFYPFFVVPLLSCSLAATRPNQEMSDAAAAIRAAREVQAETLAPEFFRQSNELFLKAKNEYRIKNFDQARKFSEKSRKLAEVAEFEAVKLGAARTEDTIPDPLGREGLPPPEPPKEAVAPYDYPVPQPSPYSMDHGSTPGGAPSNDASKK